MNPNPTPSAGLPSGTIGGRRRHSAAGHWQWQRLLAAPHRLAFAAGAAWMLLAALWLAGSALARAVGLAPVGGPTVLAADATQALVLSQAFLPLFVVGLVFSVGPRWLGMAALPARVLLLPVGLMSAGWVLALLGLQGHRVLASLGLAVSAVGWALATGLFGLMALESRADRRHASLVVAGSALGVAAQWVAAVLLALQSDAGVRAATAVGLWGGLGLAAVALLHRHLTQPLGDDTADATAARALAETAAGPDAGTPRARGTAQPLLGLLSLAVLLQAVLAAGEAGASAPLAAPLALARAALEWPVALLVLGLAWRWVQAVRRRPAPMAALPATGLAWLGLSFALSGASHLAIARGGLGLGQAPATAFAMGFLSCTLLALATHLARSRSGRALRADPWTWLSLGALQVAAVLQVLAAAWPVAATGFGLLALQFWLAGVGAWAVRHLRWFGRPRVDGGAG